MKSLIAFLEKQDQEHAISATVVFIFAAFSILTLCWDFYNSVNPLYTGLAGISAILSGVVLALYRSGLAMLVQWAGLFTLFLSMISGSFFQKESIAANIPILFLVGTILFLSSARTLFRRKRY